MLHVRVGAALVAAAFATLMTASASPVARADDASNAAPNPYKMEEGWAKLPEGRKWGMTLGIAFSHDGKNVWVFDRCGARTCAGSDLKPIQKFDLNGKFLTSFGAGMFVFPHGLFVDRQHNVWVTDGQGKDGHGQVVVKFSPEGKVLMTLGKPG